MSSYVLHTERSGDQEIIGVPEFGDHGVIATVSVRVVSDQGRGYVPMRRFYPYAAIQHITFPEES